MKEDLSFVCPKCNKQDYTAMNILEAYCHTCKGYFNKSMNVVYKNRIDWNKLEEMHLNRSKNDKN